MKIFLIGYMASGKSSLGKRIATQLNLSFLDMDQEIEKEFQLTIPQIFQVYGEETFRKAERDVLEKIEHLSDHILVSTGGGVPCYFDNMEKMKNIGITVYLKRSPKELAKRLQSSKKPRPLVDSLSPNELLGFIEQHLLEREVFYEKSQLVLERDDQNVKTMVELLRPFIT